MNPSELADQVRKIEVKPNVQNLDKSGNFLAKVCMGCKFFQYCDRGLESPYANPVVTIDPEDIKLLFGVQNPSEATDIQVLVAVTSKAACAKQPFKDGIERTISASLVVIDRFIR
jgi:hypothetical protein